jgi:hypothetical protein
MLTIQRWVGVPVLLVVAVVGTGWGGKTDRPTQVTHASARFHAHGNCGSAHGKGRLWFEYRKVGRRRWRSTRRRSFTCRGRNKRITASRVQRGLKPLTRYAVRSAGTFKGAGRYRRNIRRFRTRAAPASPAPVSPAPALAQPPGSHPVPVLEHRITNAPGQFVTSNAVWDTDHTEVFPVGATNVDKHGTIRWETGGHYAANQKTYMLLGARQIQGSPGRMFAGHNQPADDPYGWTPLESQNGQPNGVSPFAVDWYKGSGRGFEVVIEPNHLPDGSRTYHYRLFTDAEMEARRGQWIWLWVEIVWGRIDGTTQRPGSLKVWVAGEDAPRVNVSAINTHWYGQGMVTYWQTTYWFNGGNEPTTVDMAGPRFGRTPQEAYQDNPSLYSTWTDEGHGSWAQKSPVEGNVPIPALLRW